jgi:hypothetical protein
MDSAARAGTGGEYIALSDGVVHYEVSGPEGAPAVVFPHGIQSWCHTWDSTVPAIADAGYRAVRYDRFGCGYSTAQAMGADGDPAASDREMANPVVAIATHLNQSRVLPPVACQIAVSSQVRDVFHSVIAGVRGPPRRFGRCVDAARPFGYDQRSPGRPAGRPGALLPVPQ